MSTVTSHGMPPGLPHRVAQRGESTEIGEGPGEHVDVQRQQRLLAGRRPDRQRGQPAVEFGIPAGLRQDVTGLRTGEYLQRRDPSGRQIDDRLEGEAESIRPGGHGSIMTPPGVRPGAVHELFTHDFRLDHRACG